jgi:N-acetylglucosamine-6-phosphate deacetylase
VNTVFRAERVITGQADLRDAWVSIEDDRIVGVGQGTPPPGRVEDVEGWLIPGFVDVHVHGGGGGSFSNAQVDTVTAFHQAHGTTTMLASLVSEPLDVLYEQIRALLPFVRNGKVAGIHLEGPFLAPLRCGAHDVHALCDPTEAVVKRLIELGEGTIRMVTIAPELEGAEAAIRAFASHGIVAALGHSNADSSVALLGVEAGATQVTHLFNGMRPLHHRETGLADVGLLDPRLVCELILDRHHLSDEITEIAFRLLGDRWIAITDAVAAAGAPDGRFTLGALEVEARDGIVRVIESGSLAGSTLTMDRAFSTIVDRFGQSPLEAVQATATRPAAQLGRRDIGVLSAGARADILVWHDRALARVMRAGRWLH